MRTYQLLAVSALALLGAGPFAQAQETVATPSRSSEYFHAPSTGMSEVTVHGGYGLGTVRDEAPGSENEDYNGLRNLGVEYVYGINEIFKVGADVSYTSIETGDSKSSGIEPIVLKGSGNYQLGMGTLVYGLRAQFAVEKAKIEANGDSNRTAGDILSNVGEGGIEVAPWIGYSALVGPGTLGAKLSYEVINSDTEVDGALGSYDLSGGSEGRATVFYEFLLADMPLGAALNYDWYTAIDSNVTGVDEELISARSMIGVDLYTRLGFGGFDLVPMLTWREKAASDDYDKLSDVRLNLAGRFAF